TNAPAGADGGAEPAGVAALVAARTGGTGTAARNGVSVVTGVRGGQRRSARREPAEACSGPPPRGWSPPRRPPPHAAPEASRALAGRRTTPSRTTPGRAAEDLSPLPAPTGGREIYSSPHEQGRQTAAIWRRNVLPS